MKVFLSSTGRDLKLHREAAFRALQGMDLQCVRMEDFHGAAVKIEDFDRQEVTECDLFVILIGQLYGACPDDSEKSYTELEYETAVRLKKPCYLFLSDEDHPLTAIRESDAQNAKLIAFRQRAAGLIRNSCTTPETLATQIALAVRPQTPHELAAFLPFPPQPYFAHPYPLQENFTGRLKERRMLTEWLTSGTNVLSICAIGGMGKSALTWAWLQRDVLGLPLPGSSEPETDSPRLPDSARPEGVFWWSFYESKATFDAFVHEALLYTSGGRTGFDDPVRSLVTLLSRRCYLLILDGFERELRAYTGLNASYQGDELVGAGSDLRSCISPHAAAFLPWMASAPVASRVLLTTRLHPRELDNLAGCQQIDLTALDPDDAVRFFQAQQIRGTRTEIRAACEPYGYHPLALRLLAGVIVKDHRMPRDIAVASRHPISTELIGRAKHHILQVAYDALDKPKRNLLNLLAAFRNPMSHDSLAALNPFATETALDAALDDLIERALLFRSETHYDLHPVVRQYAYDRLTDKPNVHTRLRDYFAKVPAQDESKVESVDDLAPVIELYHHTLHAGQYDEARDLYRDRLGLLYHRFGAYQLIIDLMRGLFPDGEDRPPRLKTEHAQSWTLNEIANSYSHSGDSVRAVPLYRMKMAMNEKSGDKGNLSVGLRNLADDQLKLGHLHETDQSLQKRIELAREIQNEFDEAVGHQELGRLEAYQGRFTESLSELDAALSSFRKHNHKQAEGSTWFYYALRALFMKDAAEAIDAARRSRELSDVRRYERDIIRAEWLLGWSLIAQSTPEAEHHLVESLTRCRRISMVDHEPDILLAFARLHLAANDHVRVLAHAREALAIANRCEYRLVQVDCHNVLARLAIASHDRATAIRHAKIARERAWCDGPPHCYKPALDDADELIRSLQ